MTESDTIVETPEQAAEEPTATDEQAAPEEATAPVAELPPLTVPPEPGPANPSPDGQTLAFFLHEPDGALRLWLIPIGEGTEPRSLELDFEPWDEPNGPQWSPDGTRLALTGTHPDSGRSAIWLVTVEDGTSKLLVDHAASDRAPVWSPDGEQVAFVCRRDDRDAICVAAADGAGPARQLTDGAQDDRDPIWSRDGAMLAFRRRSLNEPRNHNVAVVTLATGEVKQVTDKTGNRHSLRWAPDRSQILYVTDEKEFDGLAVVNPENKAGWSVADEPGDKADPRWAPAGGKFVYTRTRAGFTECCFRASTGSQPVTIDPGQGVARSPRLLPDGRAIYAFGEPGQPFRFLVQEPKADAERTEIPLPSDWQPGERPFATPQPFEFEAGTEPALTGLLYRFSELSGPSPAVVYLDDGPPSQRGASLRVEEQTLAAVGLAVLAPHLHGTLGLGRRVVEGLRNAADQEVEAADLTDAAAALQATGGIDPDRLAVAGRGYGGLLALLVTGSRPGFYQAAVAIDPIADWDLEFDHAAPAWRVWLLRQLGLPAAQRLRYALRTPRTYAAVIDVPLLLVGTAAAPDHRKRQLDTLVATLRELDVAFTLETDVEDAVAEPVRLAATFLRQTFLREAPVG